MSEVATQFEDRLRASNRECVMLGYHPHRFEEMLNTLDGRTTAKRLIASGDLQDGLRRLAKMNRLDLSMERIMLETAFESLFTTDERDAARWRLTQVEKEVRTG